MPKKPVNTRANATPFVYRGAATREISFPLGGIGSGCIGLAGNGRLIDWEIRNRPNKGSVEGFSHFAVRAESVAGGKGGGRGKSGGQVLDARILQGDLQPPYMGDLSQGGGTGKYRGYGWGPQSETMAGLPHFRETEFRGEFPIAEMRFRDPSFPGRVRMMAFNPFIPLADRDSSIPAAFFEFEFENTTREALDYTLAFTMANPLPERNVNRIFRSLAKNSSSTCGTAKQRGGLRAVALGCETARNPAGPAWRDHSRGRLCHNFLHVTSDSLAPDSTDYGDLTLATDAADVSGQAYWFHYRAQWSDPLEVYWHDLTTPGHFKNRTYPIDHVKRATQGLLAAHVRVAPGARATVRFVLAWNFPNCKNYWHQNSAETACKCGVSPTWRNYYATQWADSRASAAYALREWDRLYAETLRFKEALFATTLPPALLDAVSANLSILKSPTVLRLEDGTFYGWEGCHTKAGCCEGSCTHVWGYAQALPFLFPGLERSMREANYAHNAGDDGAMAFRIQLPIGVGRSTFRPCADGQFGDVLKAYRDWRISGDTEWLRSLWPAIRRSVEFAWAPTNEDRWDPGRTGVLTGRQHHTLDMELFGPNSWLTGLYLAALKAGAEMAECLGEADVAQEWRAIFERGRAWVEAHLFNGKWYVQQIDLNDRAILEQYESGSATLTGGALASYWNAEHREIKYQIGEGCGIDQVLAQWHADLYGLGDIFRPDRVKKALRSLYRHNFKKRLGDFANPWRLYCLNDEAGTIICDWPEGTRRPIVPPPYNSETMHGFEYAAASHLIARGLVREGVEMASAVRHRYDGERRNPWNEFECGSNYARSMASYALLLAWSGFEFDLRAGHIGFRPVQVEKDVAFRCFWSVEGAWGEFEMSHTKQNGAKGAGRKGTGTAARKEAGTSAHAELRVLAGSLALKSLGTGFAEGRGVAAVTLGGKPVRHEVNGESTRIAFARPCTIAPGRALVVRIRG